MSNTFGFSFMKPEHREQPQGSPFKNAPSTPSWLGGRRGSGLSSMPISGFGSTEEGVGQGHSGTQSKSPLVAQASVLNYLKNRTMRTPATAMEIESATGVDLIGKDAAVMELLRANPKVEIHNEDNGDKQVTFEFFAKYNVTNKQELLFLVNRCTSGVSNSELEDLYLNCVDDIKEAIQGGEVIAVKHKEHNTVLLYRRGEKFLTELSGTVSIEPRSKVATTTEPLSAELRRGEAVRLDKQWVRVSSEVGSTTLRSLPPESVTADKDMSSRNVYLYDFGPEHLQLPLQSHYLGTERWEGRASTVSTLIHSSITTSFEFSYTDLISSSEGCPTWLWAANEEALAR